MLEQRRRVLGSLLIACTVPALFGGCDRKQSSAPAEGASQAASPSDDLWSAIAGRGTLRIGTEGTWAPWCFHDDQNRLTGFDVELGRLIARELGLEPIFVEGKWDGLLAGLDAGRWDLMINGVDRTPEREQAFAFSEPYAYNRTAVIVRADDDRIRTLSDLKGMRTANTISSTYAAIAQANGAIVSGVDDLQQTFELLLSGRIDATLNAETAFVDYKRMHPQAPVRIALFTPESQPVAIPMKSGPQSQALLAKVNQTLDAIRASGELKTLSLRFFGADLTHPSKPSDAAPQ